MNCSETFAIGDLWIVCKNPAAVVAKTYKHGNERGICSFCLWRLSKEDDSNFFERHSFRSV